MKSIIAIIVLSLALAISFTYMYSTCDTNLAFKSLTISLWAVFVLGCALAIVSVKRIRRKQG